VIYLKKSWWIALILALPIVFACTEPLNGKIYTESQEFCNKNYLLQDGIIIGMDNIVIDCNNAVLRGRFKGTGIFVKDKKNIVIKNCHLVNHYRGLHLKNVTNAEVYNNNFLRNLIGVRLEDSFQNHFYDNRDISIKNMIRSVNSKENHIKYTNKNLEGDFCRHNSCNEQTPVKELAGFEFEKHTLLGILQSAIRKWISMG